MTEIELNMIAPIVELVPVIQGEGKYMGVPHILIRMSGCPFRCSFVGSICDTPYGSWRPEVGKFSIHNVKEMLHQRHDIDHVMITGGEPTSNPNLLEDIVNACYEQGKHITVETAGYAYHKILNRVNLISLSPKLQNSSNFSNTQKTQYEIHRKARNIAKKGIQDIVLNLHGNQDIQFKFVVSTIEDIAQIREFLTDIQGLVIGGTKGRIWLMPEATNEDMMSEKRAWLMNYCVHVGWNYSDRLHILAFGNVRNK